MLTTDESLQLATDWVCALRSGVYDQGHGQLRTEDGYCCLGVLADVADNSGAVEQAGGKVHHLRYGHLQVDSPVDGENSATGVIPDGLWDALGFPGYLPDAYGNGIEREAQSRLWSLNDLAGKSFDQIADFIETELIPRIGAEL